MPERELTKSAGELTVSVKTLTETVEKLVARMERSEKHRQGMWLVLAVLFVLTIGMSITYYQQTQTSKTLGATRAELCSLYSVFLGSYNPSSRQAGPDRVAYEAAFVTFREGYLRLECTLPYVPPPTTRPNPPK